MSYSISINDTRPAVFYKGEELKPLEKDEVYKRQILFGKNVIEKHATRPWYSILTASIFDPFNILLMLIAGLSLYLNDLKTFVIMVIMVSVSSGIRFTQEAKNEKKLTALTAMIKKNITVIRRDEEGLEFEEICDLRDCVPGEFVKLKGGDLVPAEVQLIKTNNFSVDQSILTGESIPSMKYVVEFNEIQIDYDIDAANSISLKKTSFPTKMKNFFFSCLRNNLGLELKHQEQKTELDIDVMNHFDQSDLCFMGTSVISGSAIGVILATGQKTFFGVMSEKIAFQKPISAFNKRIKRVSGLFILLMLIICIPIIIFKGFNVFKRQDEEEETEEQIKGRWLLALQFALSVAVGLTPEMLPMIVNVILAKGTISLSNKNCIVKRIESIINLGNMDVLCTDKTGTLTENFARLTNIFDYKKENCSIGLELAYLNSAYQESFKNLTDQAIINAYEEKITPVRDFETSQSQFMKINEIPFDYARRKMTLVYEVPNCNLRLLTTKGAVKEMLEVCTYYMKQEKSVENKVLSLENLFKILQPTNDEQNENLEFSDENGFMFKHSIKELNREVLEALYEFNDQLNNDGNRVLAVAYQTESLSVERLKSKLVERNLIFVGFLVLSNPPKSDLKEAVENLSSSHVSIKILTGDTVEISKNICRQIGLSTDHVITSKRMSSLTRNQLEELTEKTVIFSQLSPLQKLDIVKILKAQGHVVGFLGDGVNDALALKEADVGISVDTATEIAKEAADIILLEKDINVINEGILHGRHSFVNIVKYISMVISSNFGNVLSIFVSLFWLPFLPMAPIHLLLQNLFYDLSQMTLPWDNVDKEDVRTPQNFKLRNLIYYMIFWGPVSSFFDIATFAYLYFYFGIKTDEDKYRVLIFQTAWFTVGLGTQTLIVHIARTHKIPILQSNASYKVYLSTLICLILGMLAPYLPLGSIYSMAKLNSEFYYFLAAILIAYCFSVQVLKNLYIFIFKSWFVSYK